MAWRLLIPFDKENALINYQSARLKHFVFLLILNTKITVSVRCGVFKALWLCLALVWLSDTLATAQPYGLTNRPPLAPFLNGVVPPVSPVITGTWSAVPVFTNLTFINPVGLSCVPGTNLLCVWEREGRVWTFVNNSNVTQKTLVLNITNQCQGWDDSGLLGVAFHPGFATNRFMFVYYTWVVPGTVQGDSSTRPPTFSTGAYHDKLVRYTIGTNGVAVTNSEMLLLDQAGDSAWHNGGGMFFNPANGFLYWTDGDDADTANTQIVTNKMLSGVFRIDVDKRGGSISHAPPRQPVNGIATNYFVPNDNPFVGQSNVLEEFFCLGLRSPHRMTMDPPSGRIFIGDVGYASREEVDVIESGESGLNFQWATIEGLNGDLIAPYPGISRRPVIDYPHTDGNFAVIGGYVYHGSQFATDLAGKYIFGDNGSDVVWVLDESTLPAGKIPLCTVPKGPGPNSGNDYTGISSFGLDAAGEIYICVMSSTGSQLYTISRTGPTNTLNPPALISQLGAFTNLTTLVPAPWLVPYDVNSPLWSDAAYKQRWIALPTNTTINFTSTGEWTFPAGTAFFKNFELSTNDTNPTQRRRLETRLLVCDTNGYVYGASYKWRADLSDADLVTSGTNVNYTITTATGVRTQQWYFPGRFDCLRCHSQPAGGVLGAKTRQLNGSLQYPNGVTDNQLRAMNHVGYFTPALVESAITNYTRLVPVSDTNATLELRSRSYFDANCAHCHRPGGVNALFDMRFDTPLANQGLINGYAINSLGISGAKIIKPGDTNRSVLFQRDSTLGVNQMPPIGKNVVDANAMAVIAAWIGALPLTTSALPAPWVDADIGYTLPGSASWSAGTFVVMASGADFWDVADTGNIVYQPISGNGQITARVTAVQNTAAWAKAGVMFRESLASGAEEVFVALTPANGITMQWRTNTGDVSYYSPGPVASAAYWVRLERANNLFKGYSSPDGTNWTLTASVTNVMNTNAIFGLAVTALNPALYNQSTFDNVSLIFSNGQPFYVDASATAGSTTVLQQTIQFAAQGAAGQLGKAVDTTDNHAGIISAQGENAAFGEVATNAFDNLSATKWLDFATNNPLTRASWIQYRYPSGLSCIVTQYTVTAANDAPERDPKNWRFQGSTNAGSNWITLNTRTNQTFTNRLDRRVFNVTNTTAYNVYRFQIDSVFNTNTAVAVQLAELEFVGTSVPTYAWNFGDGTSSAAQNPAHSYTTNGTYTVSVVASDSVSLATNTFTVDIGLLTPTAAQWLANSAAVAQKKFHMSLSGSDGANYIVEASTNLKSWIPVITNTPTGGLLIFTDNASTNMLYRFYRIRSP